MSDDTAAVAEMTAAGEEDQAVNEVLEKTTSNEPNAENEQDVETAGKC